MHLFVAHSCQDPGRYDDDDTDDTGDDDDADDD